VAVTCECVGMYWIELAQDRVKWQSLVNAVVKLMVPKVLGIYYLADNWLASQEGLCVAWSILLRNAYYVRCQN